MKGRFVFSRQFYKKLFSLFSREEKKSVKRLLVVIIVLGFVEVIGVVSIAPFMALAANFNLIHENAKLAYLYHLLHFSSPQGFLIFFGFVLLFIFLFANAFSAFAMVLIYKFSARQNHRLATKMLSMYLSKPYSFYLTRNTADLSKNILIECNTFSDGVVLPLLTGVSKLISIILICLLLFVINPVVAFLIAIVLGGAYTGIYIFFHKPLAQFGEDRLQASTYRFKVTNEAFGGLKEIKVLGRESAFVDKFSVAAKAFATLVVKVKLITQLPRFLLESIAFGGILLVTIFLIETGNQFSSIIPMLALYALAGYRLMPCLQQLYLSAATIKNQYAVIDVVYNDLHKELSAGVHKASVPNTLSFQHEIQLKDLFFSYESSETPVIDHLNLNIKKNTTIAFAGSTGAGKTTLVDIILGLLFPDAGSILVDGVKINAKNLRAWQNNIGYIPQEIFLCDGTIAENIAFGIPEDQIDHQKVIEAARVASLHDFVSDALPEGYETFVGERGVRLSGGQRQRVGIARAVYNGSAVLVLDEATSALDGVTESLVVDAIKALSHQKTIIMIAHRLTTLKDCDVIYFLEHGRIVDQGTYSELLEKNEQFRAMAKVGEIEKKERMEE